MKALLQMIFIFLFLIPTSKSFGFMSGWKTEGGPGIGYRNHFGPLGMEGALVSPKENYELNLGITIGGGGRISLGSRFYTPEFLLSKFFLGTHLSYIKGHKYDPGGNSSRYVHPHYNALHTSLGFRSNIFDYLFLKVSVGYQNPLGKYKLEPLSNSPEDMNAAYFPLAQNNLNPGYSFSLIIGTIDY